MKGTPKKTGVFWVLPKDVTVWQMYSIWQNHFGEFRYKQILPKVSSHSFTFDEMKMLYPFATWQCVRKPSQTKASNK